MTQKEPLAAGTGSPAGEEFTSGWGTLHRRMTVAVVLVFLATMTLFLLLSFLEERRRLENETFAHLDETLAVLAEWFESVGSPSSETLQRISDRVEASTLTGHEIYIVDSADVILGSDVPEARGKQLHSWLEAKQDQSSGSGRFSAARGGRRWLGSTQILEDRGLRILLLRDSAGSRAFSLRFFQIHALHVLATVFIFVALLAYVGKRSVRRPIAELAAYIERVEKGEFRIGPVNARRDEIGWLGRRFSSMAEKLDGLVRQVVRSEKQATASAVAYRIATDLEGPLHSLERHTLYMEGLGSQDPDFARIARSFRSDRQKVQDALHHLAKVLAPTGADTPPEYSDGD